MKFSEVNWLSRKLIITGVLFGCATLFLLIGKAEMTQWMDFSKWIFGIYAAGNVSDKLRPR
jgi:hypothetical protein